MVHSTYHRNFPEAQIPGARLLCQWGAVGVYSVRRFLLPEEVRAITYISRVRYIGEYIIERDGRTLIVLLVRFSHQNARARALALARAMRDARNYHKR